MPGCLIVLIDESAAMGAPMPRSADAPPTTEPPKSKAASVGTVLNAAFARWTSTADVEIALVGYSSTKEGELRMRNCWGGELAGQEFVAANSLAKSPLAIEERIRRTPDAFGVMEETKVSFPVWYRAELGDLAPQIAAFRHAKELLERWGASVSEGASPLVLNITSGGAGDGNPLQVVKQIQGCGIAGSSPIVLQVHLSSNATVPPALFSANRAYLSLGPMRDLFERASVLSDPLVHNLKEQGVPIGAKARGMIYNAKLIDLSRLLNALGGTYSNREQVPVADNSTTAETCVAPQVGVTPGNADPVDTSSSMVAALPAVLPKVSIEEPALVVFVLDRSTEDPYGGNLRNVCAKLQREMNGMLETLSRKGGGVVDVAIVTYGSDANGEADVRDMLEGGHSGKAFVRDHEIAEGVIRWEEFEEEIPDGVGGIIKIPKKLPVLVEVDPAPQGPIGSAFAAAGKKARSWLQQFPASKLPPIIVHLTRGRQEPADISAAMAELSSAINSDGAGPLVYHIISSETPHSSAIYPISEETLMEDSYRALFQTASPVLGAELLMSQCRGLDARSHGLAINAKVDLVWRTIEHAKNGNPHVV